MVAFVCIFTKYLHCLVKIKLSDCSAVVKEEDKIIFSCYMSGCVT